MITSYCIDTIMGTSTIVVKTLINICNKNIHSSYQLVGYILKVVIHWYAHTYVIISLDLNNVTYNNT